MSAQKKSTKANRASAGFTAEEKAAMKERARELKALERIGKDRAKGEETLLEVLSKLPDAERKMGSRLDSLITGVAPELLPRTWYGMPAYANADGKIVCFLQPASSYALAKLTASEEKKIVALVKKALG